MEIIVVLIGGFLLGIPIVAIIALVRSANTRKLLDETTSEYRDKISDLTGEIAKLRRELVNGKKLVVGRTVWVVDVFEEVIQLILIAERENNHQAQCLF